MCGTNVFETLMIFNRIDTAFILNENRIAIIIKCLINYIRLIKGWAIEEY